jgi:hypothetical protein
MRLISWVVLLLVLSGCALTGEPRFSRPLPSIADGASVEDGTVADGALSDAIGPDGIATDGSSDASPDAVSSCVPIGFEICNGIDDDCNGAVDDVHNTPGIGCVVNVMRGANLVPTLGEYRGCACVVTSRATEICGNAVDDNNNGMVDEGCECDAYVVPVTLRSVLASIAGRIGIFDTVDDALARTASIVGHRNICLFTSLLNSCASASAYLSDIIVPDNVSILGGWVIDRGTIQRSDAPECRTKISGGVSFANTAGSNTVLSRVQVRREGNRPSVSIPSNGWVVESSVEARSAEGPATALSADGPATQRFARSVSIVADSSTSDAVGVVGARGFFDLSGAQITVRASQDAVGIRLAQTSFAKLNDVELSTLNGSRRVLGVHIERPNGPSILAGVRGGASGRSMVAAGFFADCDSRTPVQIAGSRWGGASATETDAILVRGCRAEISGSPLPTAFIAFNGANAEGASRADALRCEGNASCEVLGSPLRTMSFRATSAPSPILVSRTRGVVVTDSASALVFGALIDGRGGRDESVGLEMGGATLIASHNEIIAGGAIPPEASRAVEIDQTTRALLHTNALRVHQGLGLVIVADASMAVGVTANTISSVGNVNPSNVDLVVIKGMRRVPVVAFDNNLLACSNNTIAPHASLRGLVVGEVNPFALFGYNMIAGCAAPVVVSGASLSDPTAIQQRFDARFAGAGALLIPRGSAGIDLGSGWRITASSPAQGAGSPNLGDATDMDGQPRSMGAMPDIGADEI